MPRSRTRFVIEANSQCSELFGVVELMSGDLTILPKRSELVSRDVGQTEGLSEYRITVHVSPNNDGPRIVRHVKTNDGNYERLYAKVTRSGDMLLWPLVSTLSQNRFHKRYACHPSKADRIVSLGNYCPYTSALLYTLILTDAESPFSVFPQFLNHTVAQFRRFAIHVFWGFIPMNSTNRGHSFHPKTALTLEKDGKHVRSHTGSPTKSRTPNEIDDWVYDSFAQLIDIQARFVVLQSEEASDPVSLDELEIFREVVKAAPEPPSADELASLGLSLDSPPEGA